MDLYAVLKTRNFSFTNISVFMQLRNDLSIAYHLKNESLQIWVNNASIRPVVFLIETGTFSEDHSVVTN